MPKKLGFTLIELLVVVAIVGILVTVVTANMLTAQKQARDARRMQDIEAAQTAFETFYATGTSTYPVTAAEKASAFDSSILPVDPKNSAPYIYEWNTDANSYCVCATLETKEGNASGGDANGCTWTGTLNKFCVQNKQ